MMRLLAPALAAVILLSGCAGHFYRGEPDRVRLYLKDDKAGEVLFASSFDGFALHPARKADSGAWEATVPIRGEFRYFYRVDGRTHVPECAIREKDDFGSFNCVYLPGL